MSTDAVVIWGELLWDRYPAAWALPGGSDRRSQIAGGGDPDGSAGGAGDNVPRGIDQLGGAPANVAWHFAQAGGWAQLVTRVGDDEDGRRALAMLDGLVDISLV